MTAPIPRDIPDLPAVPGIPSLALPPVPAAAVCAPARRSPTAAFRVLTALAAATGITICLLLAGPAKSLSSFTVQANILLAATMLASARRAWTTRGPLPGAVSGAALLYVVAAASVHHFLLADGASPLRTAPSGGATAATVLLHTITPAAAILDWLLLTPPSRLRLRQAAPWMLYPLAYLAFTLARGELLLPGAPARYPYPFLDIVQHGYRGVLGNALLLGLALYAAALLLIAIDHTRPNPVRHRPKTGFRLQPPVG
ncbi:Pr6Pr family membrane protein [Streptomyces sp. NPDC091377]|uniref:Pr6Pr family membrane protein n=1 Tax=Streptomyces sp. NPDC091377 TaxID=3365995 RepID=UPI00381AF83C